MKEEIRVIKRCPNCNQRLFDKLTAATGSVEIKCPRCGAVVTFNLEYRILRRVARQGAVCFAPW